MRDGGLNDSCPYFEVIFTRTLANGGPFKRTLTVSDWAPTNAAASLAPPSTTCRPIAGVTMIAGTGVGVGSGDGAAVGATDGCAVGLRLGRAVGAGVGWLVGAAEGERLG